MGAVKLTKGQRLVLEYLRDNEPVAMWPAELRATMHLRRMADLGLYETCGREPGHVGFLTCRLTPAGRAALDQGAE